MELNMLQFQLKKILELFNCLINLHKVWLNFITPMLNKLIYFCWIRLVSVVFQRKEKIVNVDIYICITLSMIFYMKTNKQPIFQ